MKTKSLISGLDKIQGADPLESALEKLAKQNFKGHIGRPGQVGGSQPRGSVRTVSRDPKRYRYALDQTFAKGGITIRATGLPNEPKKGFVVSEYEEIGGVVENARGMDIEALTDEVMDWVDNNEGLLIEDEMYLGLWLNNETGSLHIDASTVKLNRDAAIQAGIKHDQIAIWDIANGQEVATGGSGKKGTDYD